MTRIDSLRDDVHSLVLGLRSLGRGFRRSRRHAIGDRKDLAIKQYELGVLLTTCGTHDEVQEGFEYIRAAYENGNESAGGYLRQLASIAPDAFQFVSTIDDERDELKKKLKKNPRRVHFSNDVQNNP